MPHECFEGARSRGSPCTTKDSVRISMLMLWRMPLLAPRTFPQRCDQNVLDVVKVGAVVS